MRWSPAQAARRALPPTPLAGQPLVEFLDLPLLRGDEPETAGYVAASQTPWPGGVAFYSSPETTGFDLEAIAAAPAAMGVTLDALPPGPAGRLDKATRVRVRIDRGELASTTRTAAAGRRQHRRRRATRRATGRCAVRDRDAGRRRHLRAVADCCAARPAPRCAMRARVAAGARFVLLDAAVTRSRAGAGRDRPAAQLALRAGRRAISATRAIAGSVRMRSAASASGR